MNQVENEVREFWNRLAADWDIQVGEDGDSNRILNSDPILSVCEGLLSQTDN